MKTKQRGIGPVASARRGGHYTFEVNRGGGCLHCVRPLNWAVSSKKQPWRLDIYGFKVQIVGLRTATCRKCQLVHLDIREPRLRRSILEVVLAKQGALDAVEIKFARKTCGLTGGKFANLVGVSREHVSHIEQGHAENLGTAADRLTRLVLAAKLDPKLRLVKRLLSQLDENIGTRARRQAAKRPAYVVRLGPSPAE